MADSPHPAAIWAADSPAKSGSRGRPPTRGPYTAQSQPPTRGAYRQPAALPNLEIERLPNQEVEGHVTRSTTQDGLYIEPNQRYISRDFIGVAKSNKIKEGGG